MVARRGGSRWHRPAVSALLWLAATAGLAGGAVNAPGAQEAPQAQRPKQQIKLGLVPADVDTPLEKYQDTVGGLTAQCRALNHLLAAVCCPRYELGCDVEYRCEVLPLDDDGPMTTTAYRYQHEDGLAGYPMHHATVLLEVEQYLESLDADPRARETILVGYTRHRIRIDDEETKDPAKKIDPRDVAFYYLGSVVPGFSERGGRRLLLDYYASEDGLFLSVSPVNVTSLALALSERGSGLRSFEGKQFTGTGARDLFELQGGELIPNPAACRALAQAEPRP